MERIFKPGADIRATSYRAGMMQMMTMLAAEQMAEFVCDGCPSDAVLRAAATIPMIWMEVGTPQQGLPFDTNEFLALFGHVQKTD